MKRFLKILAFVPLAMATGCGGAEFAQSTQPNLVTLTADRPLLKHPELPSALVHHLRSKYPGLEARFLKAVLGLDSKYPALGFSLPRHLLEDLGDESWQAARDVADAENERYPQLGARILELRRELGPGKATLAYVQSHYPGLRTEVLEATATDPLAGHLRQAAVDTMQSQFPLLRHQALLDVSRLVDSDYSGLPGEMLQGLGEDRPLAWLSKHHPKFIRDAVGRVLLNRGPQLRQAAIAVLAQWEKDPQCHPAPRLSRLVDQTTAKHPTLLAEVVDVRMKARQELRARIQAEFPDLVPIAVNTLQSKHPELLTKVLLSLHTHYPNLVQDARQAVDAELPGMREEARSFLQSKYPDVAEKLPPL